MAAVPTADGTISTITISASYTGVEKGTNPVKECVKVDTVIQIGPEVPLKAVAGKQAAWVRALHARGCWSRAQSIHSGHLASMRQCT